MTSWITAAFHPSTASAWASAIGTAAAALVAILIARSTNKQATLTAMNSATLMAARIAPRLSADALAISNAVDEIGEPDYLQEPPSKTERIAQIALALKNAAFHPSPGTVLTLVPLRSNCAHLISSAYGLLEHLKAEIDRIGAGAQKTHVSDIRIWEESLKTVRDRLLEASCICDEAAEVDLNR